MTSLNQNVIRHKIGLLNLATELGNVSKACKVMGLSRDTFCSGLIIPDTILGGTVATMTRGVQ